MSTTPISINSNEGRIGRIGWTNQKMWGGKGKLWWSDWWGFPSIRVRREDIKVVSVHVQSAYPSGDSSKGDDPQKPGWYECWAQDDRWEGEMRYRGWGDGRWWIPLVDGWLSSCHGYIWRGPVADINGPAPDGTNPRRPGRTGP